MSRIMKPSKVLGILTSYQYLYGMWANRLIELKTRIRVMTELEMSSKYGNIDVESPDDLAIVVLCVLKSAGSFSPPP